MSEKKKRLGEEKQKLGQPARVAPSLGLLASQTLPGRPHNG
jgi:hypothetical protein